MTRIADGLSTITTLGLCLFASVPAASAFSPLLEEYGLTPQHDSDRSQAAPTELDTVRIFPGDRIEVLVPADTEQLFSGPYEVERDGSIQVPFIGQLGVQGLSLSEAESLLIKTFEEREFFLPGIIASVRILTYGPATVHITGAVFDPGTAIVNQPALETLTGPQDAISQIPGGSPRRLLIDAIRSAGGITPVADISQVQLIRNDVTHTFDLTGVFEGEPFENPFIYDGDRIFVPRKSFDPEYVRPTPLTPPTVRIFISSLTIPASSNSQANGQGVVEFAYGAHFSQALGPANCLGGTSITNSRRSAVLVRTDRKTGEVYAHDRRVEDLVRDPDDAAENIFLMPGDLVACYDSAVTNISDVLRIVGQAILPINLFWGQ